MASTFKNVRQAVSTSYTTLYTCPAATQAIVLTLQIANVDGSASADISAKWLDNSAADAETRIAHTVPVGADTAINILGGKIILEAGDSIALQASATGDLEATMAVLEIS